MARNGISGPTVRSAEQASACLLHCLARALFCLAAAAAALLEHAEFSPILVAGHCEVAAWLILLYSLE